MRINNALKTALNSAVSAQSKDGNKAGNVFAPKDRLNLSGSGMMLGRLRIESESVKNVWDKKITKAKDNPFLSLIDDAISKTGKILEQMKSIVKLAEGELLDNDRVDLQVELTRLQKELYASIYTMGLKNPNLGISDEAVTEQLKLGLSQEDEVVSDLLERKRVRNQNGGKLPSEAEGIVTVDILDIRGRTLDDFVPEGLSRFKIKGLSEKNDEPCVLKELKGKDRETLQTWVPMEYNNSKILTDEELLGQLHVSALDAKSAVNSTKTIEKALDDLKKMRADFAKFYESMPSEGYPMDIEPDTNMQEGESEKPTDAVNNLANMSIKNPKNPIETRFKEIDTMLKERIYRRLGFNGFILPMGMGKIN